MASARYQTNRFKVFAENEQAVIEAVNAGLRSDEGVASVVTRPCEIVEDQPELAECFVTGPGKPRYETEGVAAGILKMTGNMDAFYKAIQPLLAEREAMLFVSYRDEDNHLNIDGATVTADSIDKINFMQELIRIAADKTGDEHWSTDFHAIEIQTEETNEEPPADPVEENSTETGEDGAEDELVSSESAGEEEVQDESGSIEEKDNENVGESSEGDVSNSSDE